MHGNDTETQMQKSTWCKKKVNAGALQEINTHQMIKCSAKTETKAIQTKKNTCKERTCNIKQSIQCNCSKPVGFVYTTNLTIEEKKNNSKF